MSFNILLNRTARMCTIYSIVPFVASLSAVELLPLPYPIWLVGYVVWLAESCQTAKHVWQNMAEPGRTWDPPADRGRKNHMTIIYDNLLAFLARFCARKVEIFKSSIHWSPRPLDLDPILCSKGGFWLIQMLKCLFTCVFASCLLFKVSNNAILDFWISSTCKESGKPCYSFQLYALGAFWFARNCRTAILPVLPFCLADHLQKATAIHIKDMYLKSFLLHVYTCWTDN